MHLHDSMYVCVQAGIQQALTQVIVECGVQ